MNNQLPLLRLKAGRMSQVDLANKIGVTNTTIVRWEKDMSKMTVKNLLNLCEVFDVSPNELLEYKEENEWMS